MKRVEFHPPKGIALPEGKKAGDRFESMATFQIKGNGTLCLVAIGEQKMPGYEDKESPGYRDEGAEVVSAYHGAMG
jgi:hypothetical protein